MIASHPRYRYEHIADTLRREIVEGDHVGGRLPLPAELAERFHVSRAPVLAALKRLAEEGLIRRVKGYGTFVNQGASPVSLLRQVAVVMPQAGHFYEPLRRAICRELIRREHLPIVIDEVAIRDDPDLGIHARHAIARMLDAPLLGWIVDGLLYDQFPFLNDRPGLRSVIVDNFNAPGPIPDRAALAGYAHGMELAVRHLAERGRRRIFLVATHPADYPPADPLQRRRNHNTQLEDGYWRALRAAGLDSAGEVVPYRQLGDTDVTVADRLRGLLTRRERPTAIACGADNIAAHLMRLALDLNLRVPEDLALTGFFNTPWCDQCPVPLTSVSLEEKTLGQAAVAMLLDESPDAPRERTVTPQLVLRASG